MLDKASRVFEQLLARMEKGLQEINSDPRLRVDYNRYITVMVSGIANTLRSRKYRKQGKETMEAACYIVAYFLAWEMARLRRDIAIRRAKLREAEQDGLTPSARPVS